MARFTSFIAAGLLLLGLGTHAAAQDAPTRIKGATTVQAQQVVDLIAKDSGPVVLDNRKPEESAAGHIEGAIRLLDTDVSPETAARHVTAKDQAVLFCCNGLKCGRAAKAAAKAVEIGYTEVFSYALGMDEWNKLGLPVVKQAAAN